MPTPDGRIRSRDVGDRTIITRTLGDESVTTVKVADLTVTNAKIADLAVDNAKITNAAITSAKIGDAEITTAKIADLAVDNAKIDNLAVTSGKIADAAIERAKIANAAIDSAKIDNLAVGTAQIADLSVERLKLGDLAVNIDKDEDAVSSARARDFVSGLSFNTTWAAVVSDSFSVPSWVGTVRTLALGSVTGINDNTAFDVLHVRVEIGGITSGSMTVSVDSNRLGTATASDGPTLSAPGSTVVCKTEVRTGNDPWSTDSINRAAIRTMAVLLR